MNHDARARAVEWSRFLRDITSVLQWYGCSYYIKEDLKRYGGKACV